MKDLSKIIREFEKLHYKGYDRKRSKHDPTDNYFYLARHLARCMVRTDDLNSENDPVRMEITSSKHIMILHKEVTYYRESKEFLGDKNLFEVSSTNEG